MENKLNQMLYKSQKKVGYIFGSFLLYLSFINYFTSYFFYKVSIVSTETLLYSFQLIQALIFFWTVVKGKEKLKRTLQITLILIDGILTLLMSIEKIYMSLSLLIFGSMLLLHYNLFDFKKLKILSFILLIIIIIIFSYDEFVSPINTYRENPQKLVNSTIVIIKNITSILSNVMFVAFFLILFPSIYIEQRQYYETKENTN